MLTECKLYFNSLLKVIAWDRIKYYIYEIKFRPLSIDFPQAKEQSRVVGPQRRAFEHLKGGLMKVKILSLILLFISASFSAQEQLAILKPSLKDLKIEAPVSTSNYTSLPFHIHNRMIHVAARVDGRSGSFVIDTGSPSIVINRAMDMERESIRVATLSSGMEISQTVIDRIQLGELEMKKVSGLAVPFGTFAAKGEENILGLVGYSFLKDFETLFDYERRQLHLFPSGQAVLHRMARPLHTISFSMEGHLPVVALQVGEREFRFGLDSGAATNVMDVAHLNTLPEELLQLLPTEQLRCLNGPYRDVEAANIRELSIDDYPLEPMKFLFVDLSKVNAQMEEGLDGLLGYAFLSQLLCSIDYHRRKLFLWRRVQIDDAL